jgi:tricorn protease
MRRRFASLFLILVLWAPLAARAGAPPGYYRYPTIHGDTLVFTAEGDLWRVPVAGGVAERLTSHAGQEVDAAISPDGTQVAFSGRYEGPQEVYVLPLAGGLPRRLTWSTAASADVMGWTPSGHVLYASNVRATLPSTQLFDLDPSTGETAALPLAQASDGTYAPDGTLYFTRLPFQGSHTRRYKGGTAQNLWKFHKGDTEATPLTADYAGTSKTPMWWNGRIYFASDRDGTMNLWSMRPDGSDPTQLTRHADFEVQSPSLDAGRIAYQLGADIHVYDIQSGTDRAVPITLVSDFDQMREKWITKPVGWITSSSPRAAASSWRRLSRAGWSRSREAS